jgi:hypothetical protein
VRFAEENISVYMKMRCHWVDPALPALISFGIGGSILFPLLGLPEMLSFSLPLAVLALLALALRQLLRTRVKVKMSPLERKASEAKARLVQLVYKRELDVAVPAALLALMERGAAARETVRATELVAGSSSQQLLRLVDQAMDEVAAFVLPLLPKKDPLHASLPIDVAAAENTTPVPRYLRPVEQVVLKLEALAEDLDGTPYGGTADSATNLLAVVEDLQSYQVATQELRAN